MGNRFTTFRSDVVPSSLRVYKCEFLSKSDCKQNEKKPTLLRDTCPNSCVLSDECGLYECTLYTAVSLTNSTRSSVLHGKLKLSSASQKNSPQFMDREVHYRKHKRPLTYPIPSQAYPVHITLVYTLKSVLILSSHLWLGFSRWPPSFRFSYQNPVCPQISNSLITRIFGEVYKLCSSPFCNILKSPVTSCLSDPNTFLGISFSRII